MTSEHLQVVMSKRLRDEIDAIAETESRSRSSMALVLINEALRARKSKGAK